MVTTFPHLGDTGSVIVEFMMKSLGVPFIHPPPLGRLTFERGAALARESFCHPLKVLLGDMALAIEKGADTIIMSEVDDYCRYSHYWVMMKTILEREFHREIGFIVLRHHRPHQSLAGDDPWQCLGDLMSRLDISPGRLECSSLIQVAAVRSHLYNEALRLRNHAMAREKCRGDAFMTYREALRLICNLHSREGSGELRGTIRGLFGKITLLPRVIPLKILLTGDLYEVIEPGNNHHVEAFLGGLQVEVIHNVTSNELILFTNAEDDFMQTELERIFSHYTVIEHSARPYLGAEMSRGDIAFGGYGLFSVGSIGAARLYGCDGVIHLGAMGCHSESVARVAMDVISRELGMPLLSLSLDDHQAEAGFLMRIEAFIDMLRARRERRIHGCNRRC
jgi:hypothetical protein